jgi:hypothetical protein
MSVGDRLNSEPPPTDILIGLSLSDPVPRVPRELSSYPYPIIL